MGLREIQASVATSPEGETRRVEWVVTAQWVSVGTLSKQPN